MLCPHNEIMIVQRSQRQSAVAAAAYRSGGKAMELPACKAVGAYHPKRDTD